MALISIEATDSLQIDAALDLGRPVEVRRNLCGMRRQVVPQGRVAKTDRLRRSVPRASARSLFTCREQVVERLGVNLDYFDRLLPNTDAVLDQEV